MDFYTQYRYLIVPFVTWLCVQTFKVLWELATTKKFNFKRIIGAGGMPSSHTAIVVSITTMVGRRQAGKQARILNDIVNTPGLSTVQVREKLVEALGHTPLQVIVGAIVGFAAGMLF